MDNAPIRNRLIPRIQVIWSARSAPKVRWVGGLFGLQLRGSGVRELILYLSIRGALLWSGALLLAAFVVGTASGAYFLARNPYNRISYADLVLPTRWGTLREKRGLTLIDDGLHQMQTRRYAAGVMLLARGLQLEPSNIPARLVLGQVYAQGGFLQKAMQVFRDGIPYAGGRQRYLDICFKMAGYLEDYQQALDMVAEAEKTVAPGDATMRRWLRDQQATALVRLGHDQEVLALWAAAQGGVPSMALNAAWARALAGLGQGSQAMAAVEQDPGKFGVFAEPWQLLLELARETHQPAVGRRAAQALVAIDPADFHYHAQRLVYLVEVGRPAEIKPAVLDYYLRFGLDEAARVTLLKELEPVATREAVQLIWAQTEATGRIGVPERIAHVQDLIMAGALPEAARQFELTQRAISLAKAPDGGWVDGTRVLLDLLTTGSASGLTQLQAFCNNHPLTPAAFRMLVRSLLVNDRSSAAREMVALARNRYPGIQNLPEIAAPETGDAEAVLRRERERENARVSNSEARAALASLNAALAAGRWDEALDAIAKVEKSSLTGELGDMLLYDRLAIHGHLSNQTELSWYLRRLFEQPHPDPARLRALAVELHDAGQTDSALTLLRVVRGKFPSAAWAAALQKAWQDELKSAPVDSLPRAVPRSS
ncbi:MAG: hypothetical protein ACHQ4G_01720 [Opitutales bacterium]